MKIAISLLILFSFHPNVFSQSDGKLSQGGMFKHTMELAWADIENIGEDAQGTYYMLLPYDQSKAKYYFLGRLGSDLEMEGKQINFSQEEKDLEYEFTLNLNGVIHVFTSVNNKETQVKKLFVQTVNKSNLALNDDSRVVAEINYSNEEKFKNARFGYEQSKDETKLLFTYSLLDKDNSLVSFRYDVMDTKFKIVSSWNGSIDMNSGIYIFDQFRVSNSGDVFLLTRFFSGKKELRQSADFKKNGLLFSSSSLALEANYDTRIVKFDKQNGTRIFPVTIANKFLTTADIDLDGTKLIMAGFYSPTGSTLPEGTFFMELDPVNGQVKKVSTKTIGDTFVTPSDITNKSSGLMSDIDQYNNYRFVLKDIYFRKNGGYVLLGERTVTQEKTQNNGKTVTTYILTHTDDIVAVEISKTGDVQKVHKIEKNQQYLQASYRSGSFFFTDQNGELTFLYSNLGKKNSTMLGVFKDTEAMMVKIGADGNQKRSKMFDSESNEVTLRALNTFENAKGELIMYGQKSARFSRFLKWN